MKFFASKRYQRVTNFAFAAILVISTFTASVPFLFSKTANAVAPTSICAGGCDAATLQTAIDAATNGAVISLAGDVTAENQVTISKPLTLNGNGHSISSTFALPSPLTGKNNAALGIEGTTGVTVNDLVVDGTNGTKLNGIDAFKATANLNDVVTKNNKKYGLIVNGSNVTVNNITTANNAWGGIDVDIASTSNPAQLTIDGVSHHSEFNQVFMDNSTKAVSIVDTNNQYNITNFGVARLYTLKVPTAAPTNLKFNYKDANEVDQTLTCGGIINSNKAKIWHENGSLNLNWTAPAGTVTGYQVTVTGPTGSYISYGGPNAWSWLQFTQGDGTYTYSVRADSAGGLSQPSASCSIVYDHTAPTLGTVTYGSETVTNNAVLSGAHTFTVNLNEAHPYRTYVEVDVLNGNNTWSKLYGNWSYNADANTATLVIPTALAQYGKQYQLKVSTDDAATNHGGFAIPFTVDNTAPSVYINTPTNEQHVNNSATIAFGAHDDAALASLNYGIVGQTFATLPVVGVDVNETASVGSYGLSDGYHTFRLTAKDTAGNISGTADRVFVVDNTKPVATLVSPTVSVLQNSTSLNINATDNLGLNKVVANVYKVGVAGVFKATQANASGATSYSHSVSLAGFGDGDYYVKFNATDLAGNVSSTTTFTFTVDDTKPVITVKPSPATVGSHDIYSKLSLALYDNNNIASYQINNNPISPLSHNKYSDVNGIAVGSYHGAHAGSNMITVYDVAGNSVTYSFVLDSTAPTITVKASPATIGSNDIFSKLSLSLHDNTLVAGYSFNAGAFHALSLNPYSDVNDIFIGSYHGEHTGVNTITVYDVAGNSTTYTFTLDNSAPTATLIFPARGPSATSFQVKFSEAVNIADVQNPANYSLTNWPGAGGSGPLTGHAGVTYDPATDTATVSFTDPAWYVSGEQMWGVSGVRDLAGNVMTPVHAFSSDLLAPTAPGVPAVTSATNSLTSTWSWNAATDPENVSNGASGVKGYEYQLTQQGATTDASAWLATTATTATTTVTTDGAYTLHVRTLDNAGNVSTESTGDVVIDTTAPLINVNAANVATNKPVITGTVGSDADHVNVTILDANNNVVEAGAATYTPGNTAWSYATQAALPNGTYTVFARAYDAAGNYKDNSADVVVAVAAPANTAGTAVTPTPTPLITPVSAAAVLGATTDNTGTNKGDTGVKGATDVKDLASAVNSEANKGTIFGLAWYWWILILAALALIAWYIIAAVRRRNADEV